LWPFGIFNGHLVYIFYGLLVYIHISWPFSTFYGNLLIGGQFGIFSPVLEYCVKKNLATLIQRMSNKYKIHLIELYLEVIKIFSCITYVQEVSPLRERFSVA
jgi:hypothetical protein